MADIFAKWRSGLAKSSKTAFGRLATLFGATEITSETWDELEALLIQADLGIETVADILDSLQRLVRTRGLTRSEELQRSSGRNSVPDSKPRPSWNGQPNHL